MSTYHECFECGAAQAETREVEGVLFCLCRECAILLDSERFDLAHPDPNVIAERTSDEKLQ